MFQLAGVDVHVAPPSLENWYAVVDMPEPESETVASRSTTPRTLAAGEEIDAFGGVLSIRRAETTGDGLELPAPSVATVRRS